MTDHKRGELEIRQFSEAIIQTLNNEQNCGKGDWQDLPHGEILEGLMAEVSELTGEMAYSIPDWQRVSEEAVDVAAYALFAWEKARRRMEEIEQVERAKRGGRMSISKEERERLEQASQEVRQGFVEAREIDGLIGYYGFMDRDDVEACAEGVPALFRTLDGKDEQIADLQRENERLDYMMRYIDATAVDRRLTMKANEAWLNKRDREDA